jgi:tetratricopeptide (TPR) repeat protein
MKREEVEAELARILASSSFRGSDRAVAFGKRKRAAPQQSALLKFVVERTLNGERLTDEIVTREVFKKEPQTFEKSQAIARVQVGVLRKKLTEYYATDGIDDPVSIDVPVGTFVPVFDHRKVSPPDKELERGFYQIDLEAPENIARALAHFEECIRLNPSNAEAHAGKAMALCTRTLHDLGASPEHLFPLAEAEAKKALELDPNSWRGHAALAGIYTFRYEWNLADAEFNKALTINPEGTRDHGAYGPYLLGRGNYKSARKLAQRDEEEYPTNVTFLKRAALYLYAMREYAEAERILAELFALNEKLWHAHTLAALICLATERPAEALSHMREINKEGQPDLWPGLEILCLVQNNLHREARERFDRLLEASSEGYLEPMQLALGYLAFGQYDQTIEQLKKGADVGDFHMLWLHLWPFLDPLRENEEFKALLRRIGLPSTKPSLNQN